MADPAPEPAEAVGRAARGADPAPLSITVVVPTLDEADAIGDALASVAAQPRPWRVVVADGGSVDGTLAAVARAMPAAVVLAAGRGRARQMNAAAATATGDVLLFLHADTRLPEGGFVAIRAALIDPSVVGGCFRTSFDLGDKDADAFGPLGRAVMRLWTSRLWMRWHRLAFGDRGLFVRRSAFEAIGGFPDQPIFEDLDVVRAVRRAGRFVFLDAAVTTSARRFRRHGALRQQLRNLGLWLGWNLGLDPRRLKRYYSDRDRG